MDDKNSSTFDDYFVAGILITGLICLAFMFIPGLAAGLAGFISQYSGGF